MVDTARWDTVVAPCPNCGLEEGLLEPIDNREPGDPGDIHTYDGEIDYIEWRRQRLILNKAYCSNCEETFNIEIIESDSSNSD